MYYWNLLHNDSQARRFIVPNQFLSVFLGSTWCVIKLKSRYEYMLLLLLKKMWKLFKIIRPCFILSPSYSPFYSFLFRFPGLPDGGDLCRQLHWTLKDFAPSRRWKQEGLKLAKIFNENTLMKWGKQWTLGQKMHKRLT